MDGLMARNPYGKRIAQGAAQGALGAGTAGFALGGPVGGLVGLGVGGLAGGLMARPGDDEERLRARMRKLEMGVLGNEATAIRQRFMNPVRGAAQEQEVRRRALEQGTALSGAAARRGQAAQRAARGDIAEAGQEATLAVMDLGERRRQQAQRINESLLRGEELRDRAFRQNMFNQGLRAAGEIGSVLGEKTAYRGTERAVLPIAASNAADLQAIASEDPMFDPAVSDPLLPEAGEPVVAGTGEPPRTAGDLLEAADTAAEDPYLFGPAVDPALAAPAPAAPAAPAPSAYSAADTAQALAVLGGVASPQVYNAMEDEQSIIDAGLDGNLAYNEAFQGYRERHMDKPADQVARDFISLQEQVAAEYGRYNESHPFLQETVDREYADQMRTVELLP